MPVYKIDWTEEVWYRYYVEAESQEEVMARFANGEFFDVAIPYGSDIQDSIEVEEVE